MDANWDTLSLLPAVQALYSPIDGELEAERLPLAVRVALGNSISLSSLPGEAGSARRVFLQSLSTKLKPYEAEKKLWNEWVNTFFKAKDERSASIMKVLETALELESKHAVMAATATPAEEHLVRPQIPVEEDDSEVIMPYHFLSQPKPAPRLIRNESELLAFLTADSY